MLTSSQYQQLCGRTKREAGVQGFKNILDTEIPFVQAHAKMLPEKGRILAHKVFLNEFCRLLLSLTTWVTNRALEQNSNAMSKQDQSYEMKHLQAAAENVKKNLSMTILETKQELCNIRQNIFSSKSTYAVSHASNSIENIVISWSTKKEEDGHGLACNTYRAICRREGNKTKSDKSRDFNEDILELYLMKISTG